MRNIAFERFRQQVNHLFAWSVLTLIGWILRSNNLHNSRPLTMFLEVLVLVMLALADSPRRSLPWELKSQQSQVQWIETTLNPKVSGIS